MEIKCPVCGSTEFTESALQRNVYECVNIIKPDHQPNVVVGSLCKQCNKVYYFDGFGKHGDVYECKECGKINWDLTDFLRDRNEFLEKRAQFLAQAEAFKRAMLNQ